MKQRITIIVVAVGLIVTATGIGWLYFRANPQAWDSFLTELEGDQVVSEKPRLPDRSDRTSSSLVASGSIEADEVTIAAEIGGRIAELMVSEGATVEEGSLLLILDQGSLMVQLEAANVNVDQSRSAVAAAEAQLALATAGATEEEIAAAEAAVLAAQGAVAAAEAELNSAEIAAQSARTLESSESSVAIAEAGLAQAEGMVAAAKAGLDLAEAERARLLAGARLEEVEMYEGLLMQANSNYLYVEDFHRELIENDIGGRPEERARLQSDGARGARDAAQAQLDLVEAGARSADVSAADAAVSAAAAQVGIAEAGVAAAEAALEQARATPETTQDQVNIADTAVAAARAHVVIAQGQLAVTEANLARLTAGASAAEIGVLEAQIRLAEAAVAAATVSLKAAELELTRSEIRAPTDGIVLESLMQMGELAIPGAPLLLLADLDEVTLTVYVPEAELGSVSLGQAVEVTVDAYSDIFAGEVTHIGSQAEFTPRNVQTQEERVHMVFAVKITLKNADHRLKPGMPADAVFN